MDTLICKGCGRMITSQYVQALGACWHPEHFQCAKCHHPILDDKFVEHGNIAFHIACYEISLLPRCVFCNRPMRQWMQDNWGAQFCPEHQNEYSVCRYCGRLVPPKHSDQQDHDGAVRCAVCRGNAVETLPRAKPLFTLLFQWISREGILFDGAAVRLGLYSRQEMEDSLGESASSTTLGITRVTKTVRDGIVVNREINVGLLRGLPSTLFQGAAVHELGHAWLGIHGIANLPLWAKEGFCELLRYEYYDTHRTAEGLYYARQIQNSDDPVYGEGFKKLGRIREQTGLPALVHMLASTGELPRLP